MRTFLSDVRQLLPACAVWFAVLLGSMGLVFGGAYITRPTPAGHDRELQELRDENLRLRHRVEAGRCVDVPPADLIPVQAVPVTPRN